MSPWFNGFLEPRRSRPTPPPTGGTLWGMPPSPSVVALIASPLLIDHVDHHAYVVKAIDKALDALGG